MRTKKIYSPRPTGARRVPQRTCVACRRIRGKSELVRLVRSSEGEIDIDATGKKDGRGAYLCPTGECLEKAIKGKQLEYVLKSRLTPANREKLIRDGTALLKEING